MPTKRERELIMSYYFKGFQDGLKASQATKPSEVPLAPFETEYGLPMVGTVGKKYRPKRKLSAWNKYVKNKRNHIKWKSGPNKGMLNLKVMATAFRRKKRR